MRKGQGRIPSERTLQRIQADGCRAERQGETNPYKQDSIEWMLWEIGSLSVKQESHPAYNANGEDI